MATPTTSIDALPAVGVGTDTQLFIVQEAGVTKKMTATQLAAYVAGKLTMPAASSISALANPDVAGTTVQAQLTDLITRVKALET